MVDLLLDTTFLMPFLGFQVKEIKKVDIEGLRSGSRSGTMKLHYSDVSFIEMFGKLARSKVDRKSIDEGIQSLVESRVFELVQPSTDALRNAFEMRLKGHKDNIDNILYSVALKSKKRFLSLDVELQEFLSKNKFDQRVMISLKELSTISKR